MKPRYLWPGLLLIIVIFTGAATVVYPWSGPRPLYGHVLLGPGAPLRLRFIVCGLDIYWDRNADDVPQWSEFVGKGHFKDPIELDDPDGQTHYNLSGSLMYLPESISDSRPQELSFEADITGSVQYSQYGGPLLKERPEKPGEVHFHGPLSIRIRMREVRLVSGGEATDFRVEVSTYRPEVRGWAAVYSNRRGDRNAYAFPNGVAPEVELQFPSKVVGNPAIKQRFVLEQFC
jgi:hypothetical protein